VATSSDKTPAKNPRPEQGPAGVPLTTVVEDLPSLTEKQAGSARELGLTNLGKLVAYLPMRHEKHEAETTVAELVPGSIGSVRGEITATRPVGHGRTSRYEAVLHDGTARLDLVWFNAMYMRDKIRPGVRVRVTGACKTRGPGIQMANPKTEVLKDEADPESKEARVRPVYSATENVPTSVIERIMAKAVPMALPMIEDHLSPAFRKERGLPELRDAYRMQHLPQDEDEVRQSRRRLAYDELLLLQLGVQLKRAHLRESLRAPALKVTAGIDAHIRELFPFTLTPAQDAVVKEIGDDLSKPVPANRLVQGDVGSGKTAIALYAMLLAVASGHQASLMAPTELLAEQHFASMSRLLAGSRVKIELLVGGQPKAEREAILARLQSGEIDLLIGTHALFTANVKFKSLAVAIIDEQHRFGVHQRATLRQNATDEKSTPHVLIMTATPIPRTLAITLFGDLDVSTIHGLPPGRTPIQTQVALTNARGLVYAEVAKRVAAGEQAYVVVPAIDAKQPELLDAFDEDVPGQISTAPLRDVKTLLAELQDGPLKGRRLAAMHGQLARETREAVMDRFRRGEIDVLVATTVIEVGVDVANATMMVVEQADRFGLSQLHQLRGRVGRGSKASACVLIADPTTPQAEDRLRVLATVSDGFRLAEEDLRIRGPGEIFGSRQSGVAPFKVADLSKDLELLALARRDAVAWVKRSPHLANPEDALARRRLMKAFGKELGLADVG
jgi:ATP-dependent DNA helicase RecG